MKPLALQASFNRMTLESRCAATNRFLLDLEVLGWADFMIVNEKSNVAETAYYIRRCKYYHARETAISGETGADITLWTVG